MGVYEVHIVVELLVEQTYNTLANIQMAHSRDHTGCKVHKESTYLYLKLLN